jgi:hypothetical protein
MPDGSFSRRIQVLAGMTQRNTASGWQKKRKDHIAFPRRQNGNMHVAPELSRSIGGETLSTEQRRIQLASGLVSI